MGWSNFNIVVAINVIEHIYSPLEFLISLKQRLRSDGRIVLATPDFGSFWPKILGDKWPSFKIPEHVVFYNTKTLGHLLEKAGFRNFREVPFRHFFPLGLIAGKFGIKYSRQIRTNSCCNTENNDRFVSSKNEIYYQHKWAM